MGLRLGVALGKGQRPDGREEADAAAGYPVAGLRPRPADDVDQASSLRQGRVSSSTKRRWRSCGRHNVGKSGIDRYKIFGLTSSGQANGLGGRS